MNDLLLPLDLPESSPPVGADSSCPPIKKIPLELAEDFALRYLNLLRPHCHRIELAGSLRRRKPQVHDLEIVCIEKYAGAVYAALSQYRSSQRIPPQDFWIKKGLRYKAFQDTRAVPSSFILHRSSFDLHVDIFITEPQRWGWTFFIRTGSQDWNKAILQMIRSKGYTIRDNQLFAPPTSAEAKSGSSFIVHRSSLSFPEEQAIFDFLGLPFVEPYQRVDQHSIARARGGYL